MARPRGLGKTLTDKGYYRITCGPDRFKLEHRVIMREAIRETKFGWWEDKTEIPPGFTVEHVDHRRSHNCFSNLMLLDKIIHDAISFSSWNKLCERSWEVRDMVEEGEEEVPF